MEQLHFLGKYKAFVTGLIGAIVLAVVNIDATHGLQWIDFVLPVIVAVAGYIGTQVRGQWSTIVGIVGVTVYNLVQAKINHETFTFSPQDFQNLILQLAVLYGFIAMPPVKPRTYEHDPLIKEAKETPNP